MTLTGLKQITKPLRKGPSFLETKLGITKLTPEQEAQCRHETEQIIARAHDEMRASHAEEYGGIT